MTPPEILKKFSHKKRRFTVILEKSAADDNESITLVEDVTVREKPRSHCIKSDGILNKTEPVMFACRNEAGGVEISMQYEGFPLEPIRQFLKVAEAHWNP